MFQYCLARRFISGNQKEKFDTRPFCHLVTRGYKRELSDKKLFSNWVVFGSSIQGDNHKNSNRPNQDSIRWFPDSGIGGENSMLILAIADGHGAPVHFRSKKGADIAIAVAISTIREFLQQEITLENISA